MLDLILQVEQGAVGLSEAKAAARDLGSRGAVSPPRLIAYSEIAVEYADDDWRRGLRLAELTYRAAEAAHERQPSGEVSATAWLYSGTRLINVLHFGLAELGDIRLYLRAVEVREVVSRAAMIAGLDALRGLALLEFGTLLLSVYTGGRRPGEDYQHQFETWVDRARQTNDPELMLLMSQSVLDASTSPPSWPEPLAALQEVERCLREALPLLLPERRGRTLAALLTALHWRESFGGEFDIEELAAVGTRALAELDPGDYHARISVLVVLAQRGIAVDGQAPVPGLEQDLSQYVANGGERMVWEWIGQSAMLLQTSDPERALRILGRRRELKHLWADEALRVQQFYLEVKLFTNAYGPDSVKSAWQDVDNAIAVAVRLAHTARTPESAREATAAIVTAMSACTVNPRQAKGIELTRLLPQLDASLWVDHRPAMTWLWAELVRGEAVNRWRAGDFEASARYYTEAAERLLQLGMGVAMVQCVRAIRDLVESGLEDLRWTTAWLVGHALDVELAEPSRAPRELLELTQRLLVAHVGAGTSAEVMSLLFQVAKGRRFAAMLGQEARGFRLDEHATRLLERAAVAEAELPEDADLLRMRSFDAKLDDDDLVTAWVDPYEEGPSATAADRVANLQRAVERYLSELWVPGSRPPIASLDEIKSTLDDRTALILLFEGLGVDSNLSQWELLITRHFEYAAMGGDGSPSGQVRLGGDGTSVTMPMSGIHVGELRRAVQAHPGPLDVSAEGAEMLTEARERWLSTVDVFRDRLRAAGIDRLVIVPHGASRFLPLHLSGPPDKPLAGDWTVTYLANLAQLTAGRRPTPRRERIAVFGLSYSDQPRLPALPDSASEVAGIASVCGGESFVDSAATEPAFAAALESCRYVHLRAHGRMYVDAPSFHTVFLHPSAGHDGRLRAHEVMSLDLSGLELVTLGACETALARVDQSDNPRGLPAALLLAGAKSVIGTLWPVLACASTAR